MRNGSCMVLLGIVLLVLAGCASIGTPSGGPRDEQPPRFVRSNPAPGTVNFRGHRVVLDFNELVNVKDAFSKVVVSPPQGSTPRVSSQGRHVIVNFPDTLTANTTYTIDFGNAIEDNNEGNALDNFSFSFSTGPEIDTLRIAGMALSSRNLEPLQGKLVGVHTNPSDTALTLGRFLRVARTDDRGRFSIEGLAPGAYRLFALDDIDNNYRFSSPDEEMAFHDVPVTPTVEETVTTDTIYNLKTEKIDTVVQRTRPLYLPNDILLRTFLTDRRQQYVASYTRVDSTRLDITFGAPQDTLPVFSIVGSPGMKDWYRLERSATNDTLSLWLTRPSLIKVDTIRLATGFRKLDSLNNYTAGADTLRFTTDRPREKKPDKKKRKEEAADTVAPPTVHLGMQILSGPTIDIGAPVLIEFATPLERLDTLAFRLEERKDTLWVPMAVPAVRPFDDLNPRRYAIDLPRRYGAEYRLTADTLAATGLYGLHTAPEQQTFKVRGENEYSSLTLNIRSLPAGLPAFVELLNSSDEPLRRATVEGGRAVFRDLLPGKYYARLYIDYNGNGRYDTGDYIAGRQPDQAFYYPKQFNIKQNWEKEETWDIMELPLDRQKPLQLLKNKPALKRGEKAPVAEEEEDDD